MSRVANQITALFANIYSPPEIHLFGLGIWFGLTGFDFACIINTTDVGVCFGEAVPTITQVYNPFRIWKTLLETWRVVEVAKKMIPKKRCEENTVS